MSVGAANTVADTEEKGSSGLGLPQGSYDRSYTVVGVDSSVRPWKPTCGSGRPCTRVGRIVQRRKQQLSSYDG